MKSLRTASGAVAVTLFAVAASFSLNAADMTCDKNHYILDYPHTTPWIGTGSLNVARTFHTATLLPDGRVLVAGGRALSNTGANVLLDSAELYDPVSGQWSVTGSLVKPRVAHTATLLPNGKVLVVGGDTSPAPPDFGRDNTAELYDPATGTWALTGSLGTVRSGHTATLLRDGRVLVAGGYNTDNVKTAELYMLASRSMPFGPPSVGWNRPRL